METRPVLFQQRIERPPHRLQLLFIQHTPQSRCPRRRKLLGRIPIPEDVLTNVTFGVTVPAASL